MDHEGETDAMLRRWAANCRDECRAEVHRLRSFVLENHDLLTLAELKVIGAAEETLRAIASRLDRTI